MRYSQRAAVDKMINHVCCVVRHIWYVSLLLARGREKSRATHNKLQHIWNCSLNNAAHSVQRSTFVYHLVWFLLKIKRWLNNCRQFIQAYHRLHWFCGCSQRNIELMPKCGNAEAKSELQMAISNDFGLGSPSWLVRIWRISEMNQCYCIPSTIFLMNMWRYITQRTGIKYAEETKRDFHEQVISFVRI